jgi:hypothetical protein
MAPAVERSWAAAQPREQEDLPFNAGVVSMGTVVRERVFMMGVSARTPLSPVALVVY